MIEMKNIVNPIKQIGESEWVNKLATFLEEFDIEVLPLEDKKEISQTEKILGWSMPDDMKEYYLHFGGIESDDFLFNLKKLVEFTLLSAEEWKYVTESIEGVKFNEFIVFSESPGNDPLCIHKDTHEVYLFSHDPIMYSKVYNNFSDYVISEIVALQELCGELSFENKSEKQAVLMNLLNGDNIDYEFRNQKLE